MLLVLKVWPVRNITVPFNYRLELLKMQDIMKFSLVGLLFGYLPSFSLYNAKIVSSHIHVHTDWQFISLLQIKLNDENYTK